MNQTEMNNNIEEESIPQTTYPQATLEDLPTKLQKGIKEAGWSALMPVQAKALPYLFAQEDTMIQSRTGSGKTGAYLLPILELINPLQHNLQALVLVPTRELALQVASEARVLGKFTDVHTAAVYGGVGYGEQLDALRNGAHLVIGTPGRVLDHLLRRSMSLDDLKFLVFDEADRMLSMGFYPDMCRVQAYLPTNTKINTTMFSATFPPQVLRLSSQFMKEPGFLNLSSDHIHVTEVEHVYYLVPGMDKDRSLVRIIEIESPASALIFCNTKARVEYVTVVLQRFGYDADQLSSDLSQTARERVLKRIRQGKLRFLVATDVAARGIDLPELSHVFQYEPPEDPEAYIHRAGRTGRAGAGGTAISLVTSLERRQLEQIGKRFKIKLQEYPLPDDNDVEKVVSERVIALLEARLRSRDKLQSERMQRFTSLALNLGENDDGARLLTMLLDDFYQETFHAPLFTPHPEKESFRSKARPKHKHKPQQKRRHRKNKQR